MSEKEITQLKIQPPSRNDAGYLRLREKVTVLMQEDSEELSEFLAKYVIDSGMTEEEIAKFLTNNVSRIHFETLILHVIFCADKDDVKEVAPQSNKFKFIPPSTTECGYRGRKIAASRLRESLQGYTINARPIIEFLKPRIKPINGQYGQCLSEDDKARIIEIVQGNFNVSQWYEARHIFVGKNYEECKEILDVSLKSDDNKLLAKKIHAENCIDDYIRDMSMNQLLYCLSRMQFSDSEDGEVKTNDNSPFVFIRN